MPLSQDDQRASSARCYLTGAVRRRGNLAIMPQTRVIALRIDGRRVRGVTAQRGQDIQIFDAGEVIVSAGAIHSPAMLLRAGIGPAARIATARNRAGGRSSGSRTKSAEPCLSAFRADAAARIAARRTSAPLRHRRRRVVIGPDRLPRRRSAAVLHRQGEPARLWSGPGNGGRRALRTILARRGDAGEPASEVLRRSISACSKTRAIRRAC